MHRLSLADKNLLSTVGSSPYLKYRSRFSPSITDCQITDQNRFPVPRLPRRRRRRSTTTTRSLLPKPRRRLPCRARLRSGICARVRRQQRLRGRLSSGRGSREFLRALAISERKARLKGAGGRYTPSLHLHDRTGRDQFPKTFLMSERVARSHRSLTSTRRRRPS